MNMHGSMLLPRVGFEVPVVYFDGNPDRPLVLGRLYNGGAPPPYGLPGEEGDEHASVGDVALERHDAGDPPRRRRGLAGGVHPRHEGSERVGRRHEHGEGRRERDARREEELRRSSITRRRPSPVGGNQSVSVGADLGIAVKGARSESIGGMETIGVTGSYSVACSGRLQRGRGRLVRPPVQPVEHGRAGRVHADRGRRRWHSPPGSARTTPWPRRAVELVGGAAQLHGNRSRSRTA